MHEDSMKKLQGGCVSWLVLLTRAAQLLLVCGEGSPGMFNFNPILVSGFQFIAPH